jgi:hypothetical protein
MVDQLSWSEAAKLIGNPFATLAWLLAGFVHEGPARTAVLVIEGLCGVLARLIYKYYIGLLAQGAEPEGSLQRKDYDKLRASLAGGNLAARLYADWLTRFLDAVDRFFGDAGTEGQRAFGLKKPAPLWTAPAFDRCLLLALIYPVAAIFLIWAVSGHVGPAETALGLKPNIPIWARDIFAGSFLFFAFAVWRTFRTIRWTGWTGFISFLFWSCVASAGTVITPVSGIALGTIAGAMAGACAGAFAIALAGVRAGAFPLAFAVAVYFVVALASHGTGDRVPVLGTDPVSDVAFGVAVGAFGFIIALVMAAVGDVAIAAAFAIAGVLTVSHALDRLGIRSFDSRTHHVDFVDFAVVGAVAGLSALSVARRWQAIFLLLFVPTMILACLGAADLFSSKVGGPLLLFLGLLTLLNAPFDWASLGLTRALLRRGLELGGWWPYLLALVDAALAAVIIALLALTMVIGVQAFDELAVHGGGKAVLPLDTLFDGIATHPEAPEYWWVYALLLSSMIPSLINLAISGMAFTRGIPGLARLLLHWIPEGRDVPDYGRPRAAMGLTAQMFAGVALGVAAQAFLAWGIVFHVIPLFGSDLLDMARAVACFDLPTRVAHLFHGLALSQRL